MKEEKKTMSQSVTPTSRLSEITNIEVCSRDNAVELRLLIDAPKGIRRS